MGGVNSCLVGVVAGFIFYKNEKKKCAKTNLVAQGHLEEIGQIQEHLYESLQLDGYTRNQIWRMVLT